MNTASQMLNWFWWKDKLSIWFGVVSVVVAQAVYWLGVFQDSKQITVIGGYLLMISLIGTCASAFTMFTFGRELNLTSGKSSFPQWLYNLPTRSLWLGLVPVIAMILSLAWAWCPFSVAMLNQQYARDIHLANASYLSNCYFGIILPWIAMCGFATWMQAIAWWPYRSALHRVYGLLVVAFLVALLIACGYEAPRWYPHAAVILPSIAGVFAAVASVTFSRQRTWLAESSSSGVLSNLASAAVGRESEAAASYALNNTTRFSDKETALHWRDWNQLGRVPYFMMLLIALAMLAGVVFLEKTVVTLLAFVLPIFICGLTALTMGKNSYWRGAKAMSPFLAGLPVSDATLLRARFKNLLRVSLTCWGLAGAVALVWFLREENRELVTQAFGGLAYIYGAQSGLTVFAAFMLFTLYLAVVIPIPGLAVGLFGRKLADVSAALTVGIGGFLIFGWFVLWAQRLMILFSTEPYRESPSKQLEYFNSATEWLPTLLWCILIAKLCLAVVPLTLQVRRGIVSWRSIAICGAVLLAGCASLIGTFWALWQGTNFSFQTVALTIAILFPCASLLLAPVSLDSNRHR